MTRRGNTLDVLHAADDFGLGLAGLLAPVEQPAADEEETLSAEEHMRRNATYLVAVECIRDAESQRENAPWLIGDSALRVAPPGESGRATGARAMLELLSRDTKVPVDTLVSYRRVAKAWPRGTRVSHQSWAVHRSIVGREDRFAIIAKLWPRVPEADVKAMLRDERTRVRGEQEPDTGDVVPRRRDDPVAELEAAINTLRVAIDRVSRSALDADRRARAEALFPDLMKLAAGAVTDLKQRAGGPRLPSRGRAGATDEPTNPISESEK